MKVNFVSSRLHSALAPLPRFLFCKLTEIQYSHSICSWKRNHRRSLWVWTIESNFFMQIRHWCLPKLTRKLNPYFLNNSPKSLSCLKLRL